MGHTHSLIDQRFSIIAGILVRAKTLETPEDRGPWRVGDARTKTPIGRPQDFINEIARNYHCHDVLIVEKINEIWNFKKFFEPLGIVFSGLVPTVVEPSVCHSWRFVTRVELFRARAAADYTIDQAVLGIDGDRWLEAGDLDVVLLVKQWAPPLVLWGCPPHGDECSQYFTHGWQTRRGVISHPGPDAASRAPLRQGGIAA